MTGASLEGRVHLWTAQAHEASEPDFALRCRAILAPAELAACEAFAQECDRQRARLTRLLLRETLSHYVSVAPADWTFGAGPQGKPMISGPASAPLSFNLSHTRELVVLALTAGCEIGVDVEDDARELDPLELAPRVCAGEEEAELRALDPAARRQRFLELWTLKEAYLKARGLGFALEPRCIRFELPRSGRVRAHFGAEAGDDPAQWCFVLPRGEPGHTLALALRNGGRPVQLRNFLRSPRKLSA